MKQIFKQIPMKPLLLFLLSILLPLSAAADASGSCGDGVTWTFTQSTGTLTIKGQGAMKDYSDNNFPWYSYRTSITNAIIEEGVTSIGSSAFNGCSNLTSVTISNSITGIGNLAFASCKSLTSVTIPNSVTSIGAGAFGGCSSLTSITLPSNLTNIETRVFDGCNGLTSIIIPNSVTTIGGYAFWECRNLTSINIPNSVTRIEENAFGAFCGLTSITIPSSVNYIGDYAFFGCGNLSSMYVNISNPLNFGDYFVPGPIRRNMILYVPYGSKAAYETADYWKDFKSIEETIVFDDAKVKEICIANWDTDHDGNLSKEEAAAVTDLGNSFRSNSDITSFNELQYFTGLTTIPDEAFYYCSGLSSITLPDGLLTIGDYAFSGCSDLISINIPSSVWNLGEGTFWGCQNLSSITIPSKVIFIRSSTFRNCSSLTTVTILSNLSAIGDEAFCGCSNLTSITIPSSVTSIGDNAFYGCIALESVMVQSETPPSMSENAFSDYAIPLYVPESSIDTYKKTDPWNKFTDIRAFEPQRCATPTFAFTNGKPSFSCETEGVTFSYRITSEGEGAAVTLPTTLIFTVIAKKEGYLDSEPLTQEIDIRSLKADVNSDGKVSITDAVTIVNMILNQGAETQQ